MPARSVSPSHAKARPPPHDRSRSRQAAPHAVLPDLGAERGPLGQLHGGDGGGPGRDGGAELGFLLAGGK